MLRIARLATTVTVAVLMVALSGCVTSPPVASLAPPSPSTSSAFGSDAEVLAAATAAYLHYLQVSDLVGNDGGKNAERLEPLVTQKYWRIEKKDNEELLFSGHKIQGSLRIQPPKLQSNREESGGATRVGMYVCLDGSASRIIDANANDVTPANRPQLYPLVVEMATQQQAPMVFLLDSSNSWKGKNFCVQP